MSSQYLEVDGTKLFYEVKGRGPYLVCVSGANDCGTTFKPLRSYLMKYFTVVTYNRRGHFKSKLTNTQDYSKLVDDNVDDLYTLMKSLTKEKFIIFSISMSGVIVMKYLIKYPETVLKVFSHEILINYNNLPAKECVYASICNMSDVFKKGDKEQGLKLFGEFFFNESDHRLLILKLEKEQYANWDIVFEREALLFFYTDVDVNLIALHKDKLVFIQGETNMDYFVTESMNVLAESLGKEVLNYPGGHIGYYEEYKKFATQFINLCQSHSLVMDQSRL